MATIIPKSEQELNEAKPGDLVKISVLGMHKHEPRWCIYEGEIAGRDAFMKQYKKGNSIIESNRSERKYHQFDRDMGVIINNFHYSVEYYDSSDDGYQEKVSQLKDVNLWNENGDE